jgi:hypothetical protein
MEESGEETQKTKIKDEEEEVPGPIFFPSLREELLEETPGETTDDQQEEMTEIASEDDHRIKRCTVRLH